MFATRCAGNWPCSVSRLIQFAGILLLLVGCSERKPITLGPPFEGIPLPISAVTKADPRARVVVGGTMTEKCPVAGCWFIVRDRSGTIRVDTKNAGFVVVDVPLKTTVLVSGRVATNGSERF